MKLARRKTVSLAITGVMSALAVILLFAVSEIPLPGTPHLRVEFSNIPALITSALCGPGYGIAVVFIKSVLQLMATQSPSFGIGEFINFIIGSTLVVGMWLIWRDPSKGVLRYYLASIATIAATVAVGCLLNMALLPLYAKLMQMNMTPQAWWTLVLGSIPLNLLKPAVTTLPLYPVLIMLNRLLPVFMRQPAKNAASQ